MTESVEKPVSTLAKRIVSVMADVRSLPKDGHNKHDNYHYTTAATAVEAIGKAMADHGLAIVPVIVHYEVDKAQGEKAFFATTEVDYHLMDIEGEVMVSRWVGQGMNYRTPDKALKTALTNTQTTFLLKLFNVGADDDDPERDSVPSESQGTNVAYNQRGSSSQQRKPQNTGQQNKVPPDVRQMADSVGATVTEKVDDAEAIEKALVKVNELGSKLYAEKWAEVAIHNAKRIMGRDDADLNSMTLEQLRTLYSGLQSLQKQQKAKQAA